MAHWLDQGFARRHALRYRIEAPLRRPWHVLAPLALVLAAAVVLALLLPPRYRAAALVRAEWDTVDDAVMRSRGMDVADRRRQAVRRQVLDRAAFERLLQHAELRTDDGAAERAEWDSLLDTLRVEAQGSNAFLIECTQRDATRAALVANLVAADLVERAKNDPEAQRRSAGPQLLEARLAEARRLMERKKAALQRVQPETGPPRDDASDDLVPQDERTVAEMRTIAASLATARARADRLRQTIDAESRLPGATASDPEAELERARAELVQLRARYTEEHPDVERLVRQIRRLEESAAARQGPPSPRRELREVEAQIAALAARQSALEKGDGRPARPAASTPAAEKNRQRLAREYERARKGYEALLEEWQAAETATRLGRGPVARFELLREATVPDTPESPGLLLLALAGAVLGLGLGLVSALLAEMRDRTVKGPEDLAELLPLPLLATIPLVRGRSRRRDA